MSPEQIQRTYADLAELYDRQGQLRQRDWFLVLAADAAQSADRPGEADRLLGRLLSLNPHHFLKPFGSFAEALRSPDVQGYVANLRRNYPPAKAVELLSAEQGKGPGAPRQEEPAPAPTPALAPAPFAQHTEEPEVIFARVRGVPETDDPAATLLPLVREPEPAPAPPPPAPPPPKLAPPIPFAAPKPPPEPAPPRPRPPQRVPPPQPTAAPAPFAAEPKAARARKAARPEPPPAGSPLVPAALFLLMLLLGLGLAVYTFLRPFLPREWLP